MSTLRERALSYESVNDLKLPRRLPVAIVLNGRGFRKTTSLLEKPHSDLYIQLIGKTLIRLLSEIDGARFGYSFNDEITIVCYNNQSLDTEAWYDNHIQKMVSAAASIASVAFYAAAIGERVDLVGEPIFTAKAFILPSTIETVNYLIYKQHQASQSAVHLVCHYKLLEKYSSSQVEEILQHKSIDDKYDLMIRDFKLNPKDLPLVFWRGISCYRASKKIKNAYGEEEVKNKLTVNTENPKFSEEQDFLFQILN